MSEPFHFSFFVRDLPSTRRFYGDVLGCREGRSTERRGIEPDVTWRRIRQLAACPSTCRWNRDAREFELDALTTSWREPRADSGHLDT